ncbi:MAG: glycosyltransferase [Acidimicrobiia bacterium]|nr:glycosyltransferase [Acidimicrobiia bacterium]
MTGRAVAGDVSPDRAPVKVFVSARGNGFMTDIAHMVCEAAAPHRHAEVVTDELPLPDGTINLVVAPHEFFELDDASRSELQAAAAASICIGTEQPGTPWFHLAADACRRGLLTLDINDLAVQSLRAYGITTERLRLGAVRSLDLIDRRGTSLDAERHTDVLFMGGLDARRGQQLGGLAATLHPLRCDLRLFQFDKPVDAVTRGVVFGADKYDLLASSKILLNLHRGSPDEAAGGDRYFEWVRMIEAMANGCAVISEPSVGHEPLVAGEHFVCAEGDDIASAITELVSDERRRHNIVDAAHRAVTVDLSLTDALAPLLAEIESRVLPELPAHVQSGAHRRGSWRFHGEVANPVERLGVFRPYAELQRRAKRLALADTASLRRLDSLQCVLRHGEPRHVHRESTPAHADIEPDVSVVVTVYNYADVVEETLASIVASTDVAAEVIVVEDHATDGSRATIRRFMSAHPDAAILLLAKDCNEGLAAARNDGFAAARGDFVMVVDADNHLYPECLARLRSGLLDEPDAAAAYTILEEFGDATGIRGATDWDVERLCAANYIDAQAMWRRSSWERLGGYRDDDDNVFGWEDWDLWLRLAESGGYAMLHREILGRYRVQEGSMISLTNLAADDATVAIRERYPSLPWPA